MADDTNMLAAETASADRAASDTDVSGDQDAIEAGELAETAAPDSFEDWDLQPEILQGLRDMGFLAPMPVQTAVYEHLRAGKDLMVESKTGSGKTAAFGIPIIQSIDEGSRGAQALILAPTRELALQVAAEIERIAQHKSVTSVPIYGGAPIGPQIRALADGAQIIAGTPGRVLDHIRRGTLKTGGIRMLVLDECDEMLSMGFLEEIENIIRTLPAKEERQTLLFSATLPDDIQRIGTRHMREPDKISLSNDGIGVDLISHYYYVVSGMARTRDLLKVIRVERPESAIIFCNTREDTNVVAKFLCRNGFDAEAISSDLSQKDRERVMQRMRDRNLRFLVATDIAARGIDISDLSHVINYTFPESPEVYVHRTGRTGRAGKDGVALSLVGPRELGAFYYLKLIYKIRPEERELPSAAELAALEERETFERMLAELEGEPGDEQRELARRVLGGDDAERAVGVLLRKLLDAEGRVSAADERARKLEAELERARRAARPADDERDEVRDERDDRDARGERDDDRGRRRRRRRDRDEGPGERRGRTRRGERDERRTRGDDEGDREERRPRRDDEGDREERRARREAEREERRARREEERDAGRARRDEERRGREDEPEAPAARDDGRAEGDEARAAEDEAGGRRKRRRRRRDRDEVRDEREATERADAAEADADADVAPNADADVESQAALEAGEAADETEVAEDAEVAAAPAEDAAEERPSRRRRRRRRGDEGDAREPAEAAGATDASADDGDEPAAAASAEADKDDDDEASSGRRRRRRRRRERETSAASDKPATEPDGDREFWEAWADEKTDGGATASASPSRSEKRGRKERNGRAERARDERARDGREDRDDGDDEDRGGTARLYVNIGKREEATADEIRALLAEDLGDEGDQIGSVALRNTHCYVRVPDELVDRLIESLEGKTFRDREVVVERARR